MTGARAALVASALFGAALPAGALAPSDVLVRPSLSRTALWPGDRLVYTLEIVCAPNVDVLTDDLLPEKLPLTGLEVVSSDRQRVSSAGAVTYRVHHQLTSYDVAAPQLRIGEQTVRYYVRRAGQRAEDAAPAGEVRVPMSTLALRSTLPEALPALAVRDGRAAMPLPVAVAWAAPVGLGLVLLSAAPVALWAGALAQRARAARGRRRERQRQSASSTRGQLEALRDADVSNDAARRAAFDRLDALVRQHLAASAGLPARALTAAEIRARLLDHGQPFPADAAFALLEECERARYGPPDKLPPPERFRAGWQAASELLEPAR